MARIRYIKPEFFEDVRVAELSLGARLLYIGMWTLMDRNGLIEANVGMLRSRLFAFDELKLREVEDWLNELFKADRIQKIVHQGQELFYCPKFSKHQKFHPHEKAKYQIDPVDALAGCQQVASNHQAGGKQVASSTGIGTGTGTGTGTGSTKKRRVNRQAYSSGFEEAYEAYPRKEGKSAGYKIYLREVDTPEDQESLLRAIENYRRKKAMTESRFLLHFGTFMGQWHDWLDELTGSTQPISAKLQPKSMDQL